MGHNNDRTRRINIKRCRPRIIDGLNGERPPECRNGQYQLNWCQQYSGQGRQFMTDMTISRPTHVHITDTDRVPGASQVHGNG